MGEMVAGIALGPSLLGAVLPQATALLFPPASMATLGLLSQIGVVLFMFIVGMELDLQHLRERASSAIMVSHASIIIPFLLGAGLALSLFPTLAPPGGDIHAFCAVHRHRDEYYSVSRSSSHPPDRQLSQSPLGTSALACAAVGDVSAWCILAVAIAAVNSTGLSAALLTVLITLILVAVVGKLGGKHADGALDAYDLARFVCDRCFNEHSRRTLAD